MNTQERDKQPETPEQDERQERLEWFLATRVGRNDKLASKLFAKASRQRKKAEQASNKKKRPGHEQPPTPPGGAGTVNWTPIGPSVVDNGQASQNPPVSGRITSIAVGPGGNRVYAGAANGGVWFSADAGSNWAPLDDYDVSPTLVSGAEADSLSVGAIAVVFGASAATDTVYVGTGEPNGSADSYFGIGIRSSTSGGAAGTWNLEATNLAGRAIYRIVIDPDDSSIVFAATTAGLFRRPAAGPFTNWTQVASAMFTNPNGMVTDLIVAGTGAAKRFYAVFQSDRVYRSPDGTTWTALTGLPAASARVVLAAGENDPTVVYALTQSGSLLRLVGTAFQVVTGVPNALFFGGQGWYDIALAVDPANANTVYLVGDLVLDGDWTLSLYKGTITGGPGAFVFPFNAANDVFTDAAGNKRSDNVRNDPTWIGRGVHSDGHAIAFALNTASAGHDGSIVWVGSDGGLFRSTASGALGSFVPRNTGLAITEMTYLAQRPDTDALVFSGCQDNGTVRFWGEPAWFESPKGDGGGVAIDPNNQYRVMRQYVRASLSAATDGGATGAWTQLNFPPKTSSTVAQKTAAATESNAAGFYGPIAVSPNGVAPTMAAFGTNRLWLTADWGGTWVTLPTATNPYTPATPNAAQDVLDGNSITAIAIASGTRIFAATRNAVWLYDKTGATWARTAITTTGLPAGRFITALSVRDAAAGSFYVALGSSGFSHVWFFDGTTWRDAGLATATLDAPCHAIVVDPANPDNVYLGSDVGCWLGVKTGATAWNWSLFSRGLPEAAITDLAIHARTRLLRAATHGRGVWEILLDATTDNAPELYMRVNHADTGRVLAPGPARYPWLEGAPDPTAVGFTLGHWMSPDIKVRRPSLTGLPALGSTPPEFLDFAFNIGDHLETSSDTETADTTTNRIFIQVHNRTVGSPVPGSDVRVLLLLTDAAAGLPPLPANYAAHIVAGDPPATWLVGSSWRAADAVSPYRTLPGTLDVRVPQVVDYNVDFTTLSLPGGHDHVCAAAFITTISSADQITGTVLSLDQLTMQDRHAVHRNLHLVAAGSRPAPAGGPEALRHDPQTILIDFQNALKKETIVDLVFERKRFPGHFSLLLPKLDRSGNDLKGWKRHPLAKLDDVIAEHYAQWSHALDRQLKHLNQPVRSCVNQVVRTRLEKLSELDRSVAFVALDGTNPAISRVRMPARGRVTAAITLQAPPGAKPGDRFRFDVIQRRGHEIIGGSSYVFMVMKPCDERRGIKSA